MDDAPIPIVDADDAPPAASTEYQLVKRRELDPRELETHGELLEVVLRWGSAVLHVAHLAPGRDFVLVSDEGPPRRSRARLVAGGGSALGAVCALAALLAEEPALGALGASALALALFVADQLERARARHAADDARFAVPGEALGGAPALCVVASAGARARFVFPPGADGEVRGVDGEARALADLVAAGACRPLAARPGAHEAVLDPGAEAAARFGGLAVSARWVARPRALPRADTARATASMRRSLAFATLLVGALVGGSLVASAGDDDPDAVLSREAYDERLEDLRDRVARARGDERADDEDEDDEGDQAPEHDPRPWWER